MAYIVINKDEVCTAYAALTGRFPCCSSSGDKYLLIQWQLCSGHTLTNRKNQSITEAWRSLYKGFTQAGIAPNTYDLDNEISTYFIEVLEKNNTTY